MIKDPILTANEHFYIYLLMLFLTNPKFNLVIGHNCDKYYRMDAKTMKGKCIVMVEFLNFWKGFINFSARTTRKGYWMAFLFYVILSIIVAVLSMTIGPDSPFQQIGLTFVDGGWVQTEHTNIDLGFLYSIWMLATFLPYLAISVRRLRDAGKKWTWIFINLIPILGTIFYIVLLCKPSIEGNSAPVI
jgi:uncharacterized membrane protein YhaH (DUF805 family)